MGKISSKIASVTVPTATIAGPVSAVVVLSVNETPKEVRFLDSTEKLKNIESGVEFVKNIKPSVSENEISPVEAPKVEATINTVTTTHQESPEVSGSSGSPETSTSEENSAPQTPSDAEASTEKGKEAQEDSSDNKKETTSEDSSTTSPKFQPPVIKVTAPQPEQKIQTKGVDFGELPPVFANLFSSETFSTFVSSPIGKIFSRNLPNLEGASEAIVKVKQVADSVSPKVKNLANEAYQQLPTVEEAKEKTKKTVDNTLGGLGSFLGRIQGFTDGLSNLAKGKVD